MSETKLIASAAENLDNFREWLRHEIAKSADVGYVGADFSMSIDQMGMSSIHVVRLTGEIEKLLGLELDPSFMYDFDSVDEMCVTLLKMREGRASRQADSGANRVTVNLAATFTGEPIEPSVRHALTGLGFEPHVAFARYNQVFQELLNPHSLLASAKSGVNVLLVRFEDWFRYGEATDEAIERTVQDFLGGLAGLAAASTVPMIVALAPHSPATVRKLQLAEKLHAIDQRLIDGATGLTGVHVLDLRRVDEAYHVGRVWDEARDKLGHIPFTQPCYTAMGATIARRIAAILIGPAKVIVLDCDNTLWGGVTGEDGPEGVRVDGPFAELQRFMVEQQQQGKLLCLASKNNEADVWKTFEANPEMPLRREHIVASRIDWNRKSDNIRALASELNLGLDDFVFVDDNPMEIDEVSSALPQVLCVKVPAEATRIGAYFKHHWAFDTLHVTAEDRRRTQLYQENRERDAVRDTTASFEEFLDRLEVNVDLAPVSDAELERVAQLTHRTNQFNAKKVVRAEAEIAAMRQEPGRHMWRVRVADRFGDYGLIGLVSCLERGDAMVCDTFLMSCRVLGRRVEHAMVRQVAEAAAAAGKSVVAFEFVWSDRNQVARTFFESLAGAPLALGDHLRFAPDDLETHLQRAKDQHQAPEPSADGQASPASRASLRGLAAAGFDALATAGPDLDALQAAIDESSSLTRPNLATEYVTPRTAWEKKVAAIWRDVLRVDRVGIYDSFFELGGDSLRAAEAFARMWDLGVPESISLQTIPDPTVAGLAVAIEDVKAGRKPTLLADKFSLEDEGQLAEDIRHDGYDVSTYDRPMKSVFLTGATGYIGAFVISELLSQTDVTLHCLVRAATPEDGRDRIAANLRRYELWKPEYAERVGIVLGDLTEPCFGLGEAGFKALAASVDTIFHSAAWVNFVYPYQHLKKTNVDSTETVLRLAVADLPNPIQVHFVSTLGVIMSTGYGRDNPVYEHDPLLHADDLLNGYEQTKYASDKMVWTAMKERGIPAAIYRPGMVSGLSDGTYHKLDEFMPQFLKGCIQLGSWPILDTTWEMAPIDYVSKCIVHVARNPKNLNKAYFSIHPDSKTVPDYIEWHRQFGYEVRGLPFDVWKRELLSLGTERLRKNALFPFVDFIRALSEEQVYFPPTDKTQFHEAIADLDIEVPDQLTLLERYTRNFIKSGYYANLPSGPRSKRVNEKPLEAIQPTTGHRGDLVDDRVRFDGEKVDASESYYVLWNDPAKRQSMVVRYVLHNGPIEEAKVAEVWCWFRDQENPKNDVAIRQRYPLGRAEILNQDDCYLRIANSGYGPDRAWGEVKGPEGTVKWDLALDKSQGVGVERVTGMDQYDLFAHFQSNGVKMKVSGSVVVNGDSYTLGDQLASDGHYWDTKHLKAWSWAHCANFEGDPDFLFEGIAPRFNDWTQPCVWVTFVYKGEVIRSNLVDAFYYNRETDSDLTSWSFTAERGDLRFVCKLQARPEDQVLIVHALPDDEFLYTHITYCGDMTVDIERKEGGRWWKFDSRVARRTASFEVTRKVRNPDVLREFRIVRAR
jgi:FkbH-like protein/thioester reductase-like protein